MQKRSNLYKKINRSVGRAIHKYEMIEDGDLIVVGVSGGKDSMTLLRLLTDRLAWAPVNYTLYPVFVDPGFPDGFGEELILYCRENGWDLRVEWTNIGVKAHEDDREKNPCFTCSRQRRKILFDIARDIGANRVALGHNKDDLIETLFINMFQAGQISTMVPSQSLFDGNLTVIRPLAFADEEDIRCFSKASEFPSYPNPCPSASNSKRKEIKDLLSRLYEQDKSIKGNIFKAMGNVRMEYMLK